MLTKKKKKKEKKRKLSQRKIPAIYAAFNYKLTLESLWDFVLNNILSKK